MMIVGLREIARMFNVKISTVYQWDQRGILPEPLPVVRVGGSRVWSVKSIEKFAEATNRSIVSSPYPEG